MQENGLRQVTKRFPKLEKDAKTEVLVIGGGITGILCSYFLQQAGYESMIVEMDEVGSGASGASSGILYYGSGTNLVPAIQLWGKEAAQFVWKETADSIKDMAALIGKNNIDCIRKADGIMAANTIEQTKLLEEEKRELEKAGLKHNLLSSSDLRQFYIGQKFESGLHFYDTPQIYPALFAAELALKSNLKLFEYTKMETFKKENDSFVVNTSRGKINCGKIIFATNDFPVPPEKSLGLENHFKQESSVIIASQRLTRGQIEKFYPKEAIVWTMDENYDIVYPHEDRLILEIYRMVAIQEKLALYYPDFNFKQEAQWGSSWGRTSDWLPLAGEVQKGVFAACATGDQGSTIAYTIAKYVKDMVEGRKNRFLDLTDPKRFIDL